MYVHKGEEIERKFSLSYIDKNIEIEVRSLGFFQVF